MDPLPHFSVDVDRTDGRVCVRPQGELDIAAAPQLEAAVAQADGEDRLILDLSGLRFIDSTGIHQVLKAEAGARHGGREFAIVPGPPQVHRVFELAGLADRLPWTD